MQRYALAPLAPTPEQILVTIPSMAHNWTIARRNRGAHRLLLPVDASLRALDALRYITEDVGHLVAGVHLVNVQSPVMTRDRTAVATADVVAVLREAAGQRIIALAREAFSDSGIPVTDEVAFGAPAETICHTAEKHRCTGIKSCFRLLRRFDWVGNGRRRMPSVTTCDPIFALPTSHGWASMYLM